LLISGSIFNILGVENRPKMRRACLNRIDSTLELQWNKPTDICGTFTRFDLYGRDNNLAVFQKLGEYNSFILSNLNIKLSNLKNWEFYLIYHKSCNGIDSIFSDTIIIDNIPPINSDLDSVSVEMNTQKTILGWSKNSSSDVKGYIIYHVTSTNSVIADTNSTSYLDNGIRNPSTGSENYSIAAYDSCNNTSLISIPHRTIYIQGVLNQCLKTITLSWSPYIGWNVSSYDIFVSTNGGAFKLAGNVVQNISSFTYNFSSFGDTYCFYIRGYKDLNPNTSSSSNKICVSTGSIIANKNSYIAKVSVYNNIVELVLITETGKSLQKVNVYKKEGNTSFALWQSLNTSGGVLRITDPSVYVHSKNYSYYFTTEGPCNLIFDTSQISTTILLSVLMVSPGDQLLNWTPYNKFIKNTQKQELLLSKSADFNNSSTWNTLTTYSSLLDNGSDQTNFSVIQDKICYCIRAIENDANLLFGRKDTSYSNIECLNADPIVYFPNAIQINGFNTSFYPKGVFIDYTKSSYQIYNRWGQLVFETDNIQTQWFGTYNYSVVESEVFAYKATIVGLNGTIKYYDGTIIVLK
jgi:hypothetical protein